MARKSRFAALLILTIVGATPITAAPIGLVSRSLQDPIIDLAQVYQDKLYGPCHNWRERCDRQYSLCLSRGSPGRCVPARLACLKRGLAQCGG